MCGSDGQWSWSPTAAGSESGLTPEDLCDSTLNCWGKLPQDLVPNTNTSHCEGTPREDLGNSENLCEVRCADTFVPEEEGVYAKLLCPEAGPWKLHKYGRCVPTLCSVDDDVAVKTGSGDHWRLLSFRQKSYWNDRYLPQRIGDAPARGLNFHRCVDGTFAWVGSKDFDVMCCAVSVGQNAYVPVLTGTASCPESYDHDFKQCQPKAHVYILVRVQHHVQMQAFGGLRCFVWSCVLVLLTPSHVVDGEERVLCHTL